jgi:hypothetical protein
MRSGNNARTIGNWPLLIDWFGRPNSNTRLKFSFRRVISWNGGDQRRGGFVADDPVVAKGGDEVVEVLFGAGFGEEGIRAEGVGAVDLANFVEAAENDNEEARLDNCAANPFKDGQAIHAGHLQIEQDDAGKWIFGPVIVRAFAGEVGDGLFTVADFHERIFDTEFFEGAADEEAIVGVVVDE